MAPKTPGRVPSRQRWTAAVAAAAVGMGALGLVSSDRAGADSSGAGSGGGTVSVGASSGSGSGGASGGSSGGSGSGGSGGGGSSGASPWTCTYTYLTLNNEGGFPNGGPTPGAWYSVTCVDVAAGAQVTQTVWITGPQPTSAPAVDPRALALQAENSMTLPAPGIRLDPAGTSVVGLGTWFWIDPTVWHNYTVSATAGTVSATAVARPIAVRWTTGDGSVVTCAGPGTAYDPGMPASWQTTQCAYTYRNTSIGQPTLDGNPDNGTYVVSATIQWDVSWSSTGVAGGGALPTLSTSSAALLRVVQIESVNTTSTGQGALAATSLGGRP